MPPAVDRERVRAALARRLGVDVRALAALRISLGALVLADLAIRARELETFYTDAGVLPRTALAELYPTLAAVSLHAVSGAAWVQWVLFGATAVAAIALAAGYHTRLATLATLLLVASMQARNPLVLNGGDGLLTLALLFGAFLPLGRRWSVDAVHRADAIGARGDVGADGTARGGHRIASIATAGLLAQLVVIYTANAAFKFGSDAWTDGHAVLYVLQLEGFSVLLGPALTAYPRLLAVVGYAWMALLAGAVALVLATGWRRTLVVAAFALAHLGMLATMRLGLFPLEAVAILAVYLPAGVWRRLETELAARGWLARGRRFARRIPPPRRPGRLVPSRLRSWAHRAGTIVVAVLLLASLLWPALALGVAPVPAEDAPIQTEEYAWQLFAPDPPTHTRWVRATATLPSGERVNAFDGTPVETGRPRDAATTYPSVLWHRYLFELRFGNAAAREPLGAYLCRRGVPGVDTRPRRVAVTIFEVPIPALGGGAVERVELVTRTCDG